MRTHDLALLSAFLFAVWSIQAPQDGMAGRLKKFLNDSGEAISKGAEDLGTMVKEGAKDVGNTVKEGAEGSARAIRKVGSDAGRATKKAGEDTCFSDRHARPCSR
jgi:hypothetical protein